MHHGHWASILSSLILVNIYAPNLDDHNFFTKLFSTIPSYNTYNLIKGGNFNCVLNTTLDRSLCRPQFLTKSTKVINDFCAQSGYLTFGDLKIIKWEASLSFLGSIILIPLLIIF